MTKTVTTRTSKPRAAKPKPKDGTPLKRAAYTEPSKFEDPRPPRRIRAHKLAPTRRSIKQQ